MKKEKNRTLSAIDVGTSKVTTLISEFGEDGGIKICGVGVAPTNGMKKGLVIDLDKVTQSIHSSVDAAEKMADRMIVSAYVGISGDHIGTSEQRGMTNINDPERGVTRDDMKRAVAASKCLLLPPQKQMMDVIQQGYLVDGHGGIDDPEGMSGNRLEVDTLIVTGSTAMAQNLTRCIMKLDISIDSMILSPLASGMAVLNDDEKEIGTILIDFGAGTTEVAVFHGNRIRKARVFPVGSNHINNDIAIVLGTSPKEAERLKLEYGKAYVDEQVGSEPVEIEHVSGEKQTKITRAMLCEVISARVYELIKMVRHDLETDLPISVVPAGIVITGGGSKLSGFGSVVEEVLNMSARIGEPIYSGEMSEKLQGPEYAAAFGILRCAARQITLGSFSASGDSSPLRSWYDSVANIFRGMFK